METTPAKLPTAFSAVPLEVGSPPIYPPPPRMEGSLYGGPSKPPAFPSLATKLAQVMGTIERIQKTGTNEHFNYTYATEADVLDCVRKELADRHVIAVPRIRDVQFEDRQGRNSTLTLCTVKADFQLIDGDTGETMEFLMYGQASDSGPGDKAFYKALSGLYKYAILKLFLISAGQDPEIEPRDEGQQRPKIKESGRPAGGAREERKPMERRPLGMAEMSQFYGQSPKELEGRAELILGTKAPTETEALFQLEFEVVQSLVSGATSNEFLKALRAKLTERKKHLAPEHLQSLAKVVTERQLALQSAEQAKPPEQK